MNNQITIRSDRKDDYTFQYKGEDVTLRAGSIISIADGLNEVVSAISKDDRILVEGRLQITTVKNDSGAERRIYEIDANTIETMGASTSAPAASSNSGEDIVKFSQEEFSDELIGEDEIPF